MQTVEIDLGKGGAKWKHGWIPLNAEAEAILAAKSEHAHVMTHSVDQLHGMSLDALKKHYSATIKAHGFQHVYTKKVGKAVGSHPEALAKTKAAKTSTLLDKLEVKHGLGGTQAPAAPAKATETAPDTATTLLNNYPGSMVAPVHSVEGKHIGYAVLGTNATANKKHSAYDLQGKHVGGVNSFTGAQHALGETSLGKPKGVATPVAPPKPVEMAPGTHDLGNGYSLKVMSNGNVVVGHGNKDIAGAVVKHDDGTFAAHSWGLHGDEDQKLSEHADQVVASMAVVEHHKKLTAQATIKTPPGYNVTEAFKGTWAITDDEGYAKGSIVASDSGKTFAVLVPDPYDDFGDYTQLSTHKTFDAAMKALVAHHEPKAAKPEKIPDDPPPPTMPHPMAKGWSVGSAQALDDAPVGTVISGASSFQRWEKQADGSWQQYHKIWNSNTQVHDWRPITSNGKPFTTSSQALATSTSRPVWGPDGKNNVQPDNYGGPRFRVEQSGTGIYAGFYIVDNYNGVRVSSFYKTKSAASNASNKLNKEEGTPTAGMKKAAQAKQIKQAKIAAKFDAGAGLDQAVLAHPIVPKDATPEQLVKLRFNGDKAGKLTANYVEGSSLTPDDTLFGHWGSNSGAAKRNVAKGIADRMAEHDGFDNQENLDAAWASMQKAGAFGGTDQVEGFIGNTSDSHSAEPVTDKAKWQSYQANFDANTMVERGTPEYRRIMREKMVGQMVQWWAGSSNDNHALTLSLQDLAAEHFGIKDHAPWSSHDASTKTTMELLKGTPGFRKLAISFLQSQYDHTQSDLAKRGITHITVQRGMKGGVNHYVGEVGALKMRPMSSWSTNASTANSFAGGNYVLQTTVPAQKVIGYAGTGFGCLGEYEVVLLGGQTAAKVVKKGSVTA